MLGSLITNPAIYQATQSTITQVVTETSLKAIGRPSFILADNKIDNKTKKFAATKEFLYQLTCLGIYLALIVPIFKNGAFKIAKKLYPNEPVLNAFKNPKDFKKFSRLSEAEKETYLKNINKDTVTFSKDNINEDFAKGIIEGSNIVGSVTGLALLAPIVSHPLIRPILKTFGLSDNKDNNK